MSGTLINVWVRCVGLVAVCATLLVLFLGSGADAGDHLGKTTWHLVRPGETVWSIAGDITGPDRDVRQTVRVIKVMNRLESPVLKVGQPLVVPAFEP